jgi:hypothetical protein
MHGKVGQPDANKYKIHMFDLNGAGSYAGKLDDTNWTQAAPAEGSLTTASDGSIIAGYRNDGNVAPGVVRRYNASGTILNTYTLGGSGGVAMAVAVDENETGVWFWAYHFDAVTYSSARYFHVRMSDGVALHPSFDPEDGTFEFDSPFTVLGVTVGPSPSPSSPPPTPPAISTSTTDCSDGTPPTGMGPVLPPVALVPGSITLTCSGGGDVPSADDAEDSENWVN